MQIFNMERIYKYKLKNEWDQNIEMLKGSKILTAQLQGDEICIWAMVDENNSNVNEKRNIVIIPTGTQIKYGDLKYIATVQQTVFVWHIFEAL